MFQLLQPIWLFSIAGIALPLIIHLWNIREGKTLKVGSISLLKETMQHQAHSLKLKDILLLMLRCLLIITLAFLLAKPTWQKQLTAANEKGWIMIEKQSLREAYKNFKPTIDSLINTGYKFHYFNKGFEIDKLEDALKRFVGNETGTNINYWILLKQLNELIPAELPVYLFTNNQLKRFTGSRPIVSLNLKWNTYTSGDTLDNPIAKAYKTATDSILIFKANSRPTATFYTSENIADANKNSHYELKKNNGKLFISYKSTNTNDSVEVDTSALDIAIYTDQFTTDAVYLKAAIDAIQQYTRLKIKISIVNNPDNIKPNINWLFWLSEKTLVKKTSAKVFVYEKGKEQQINSWITTKNNFSVIQDLIHLSRLIQTKSEPADNFETLWQDGFGHTVLSLENTNNYLYHFYSRFNPDWNDLPWNSQFVEMIFDLLIKPDTSIKNFDNRVIDITQLQPDISKEKKAFNKQKFIETTDLTKLFWLIALIILCIERYISLTDLKQEVYA